MRRILLNIIMCAALLFNGGAAHAASAIVGLCNGQIGDPESGLSKPGSGTISAATIIPSDMLAEYAGMKITRIRIGLAMAEGFANLNGWVRTAVDGQNLGSTTVANPVAGWNDSALETPVIIQAGQDLVVGYSFDQASSCKCISLAGRDETEGFFAASAGYWIGKNGEWENRSSEVKGSVCVEIVIEDESLPQKDLSLASVVIDRPQVRYGEPFTVMAIATNKAMTPISDITFSCSLENMEVEKVTHNVELNNRESDTACFTLPSDLVPMGLNNPVRITLTTEGDEVAANNTTDALFSTYDTSFDHKLLVEEFSTELCPNCKRAIETFATLMEEGFEERSVNVVHHVGYRYDWLTVEEDKAYEWFYGEQGTYAPAAMFDRLPVKDYGGDSQNPDIPVTGISYPNYVRPMLENALSYPSFVRLEPEVEYDSPSRLLKVNISVEKMPIFDTQCAEPRLTVYLVEDSILHHAQAGYTSETFRHRHVYRKALSDIWGDPVSFEGEKTHASYSFSLPESWNERYISVVAFVHERDELDRARNRVFNAAEAKLKDILPSGIVSAVVEAKGVQNIEYYSPYGVRFAEKPNGVCLQRTIYTDGSCATKKIFIP